VKTKLEVIEFVVIIKCGSSFWV